MTAPPFGWGHINVNVSNLERSIAFYRKLGFELLMPGIPYLDLGSDGPPRALPQSGAEALGIESHARARACILQLGDGFPKLDLTEFDRPPERDPAKNSDLGIVRLCLASRDLRADYADLCAQGVPFVSPPRPGKDGLADIAVCKDPDGTLIELIQAYLERWPQRPPGPPRSPKANI